EWTRMQALSQAARPGEEDKVRRFGATCAVSRGYSLAEAAWALVEKSRAAQDLAAHAERLGLSGPRQYFVVDVGCWLGRLLYVMEQARFYPRYLGIDANRAHVEEARRLNGGNKRATFYEADLVAWGGCKDAPDAIVCLQCLVHVPKKEALWAI